MLKKTIPPKTFEYLEQHFKLSGDSFAELGVISLFDIFGYFYFVPLNEKFYRQTHFGIEPISFRSETEINVPSDNPVFSKITADRWINKFLDLIRTSTLWVFDIGAFVGDFSFIFSSTVEKYGYPQQQVNLFAFEPNPRNCNLLRANFSLNKIQLNRAEIKEIACGARNKNQQFVFYNLARIGGKLVDSSHEKLQGMIISDVDVLRIDSFLDKTSINRNDVICIKIDTEGGEADVMSGAGKYLPQICLCILEYWPQTGNILIEGIPFGEYLVKNFDILLMGNSLFSKPLPWKTIYSAQELNSYAETVLKDKQNLDIACINKNHALREALIHAFSSS